MSRKDPYDNFRIPLDPVLLARLRPILAQRQKDDVPVELHTPGMRKRIISMVSIIHEAIELYCDLHIPIPTTPGPRLTPDARRAKEDGLIHNWADVIEKDRDLYIINLARRLAEEKNWRRYFPEI